MFKIITNLIRNRKDEHSIQPPLPNITKNDLVNTLIRAKSKISEHRFLEGLNILEEMEELNIEKCNKQEVHEYFSLKAFCLMQLNYSFDALEYYNKAIKLDDEDLLNFYERGIVFNSLTLFKEAINDFNNAIELSKISSSRNHDYELDSRNLGYSDVKNMIDFYLRSAISSENRFSTLLDKIHKSNDQEEVSKLEDLLNMMKSMSLSKVKKRS